jgi:phosphoribosylformylglycinamidine cyclo-ligase
MGSNGLTSARHDMFSSVYRDKYPETYDSNTNIDYIYSGSKLLTDTIEINGTAMDIGKLVLSPTRTFLPILKQIIPKYRNHIAGIIHNTGGGHSKVTKYLQNPLTIVKDNLLPVPPLFRLIQKESGATLEEMYKVFNMGTRLEIYVPDKAIAEDIVRISKTFNVDAAIIGHVEKAREGRTNVLIKDGDKEVIL